MNLLIFLTFAFHIVFQPSDNTLWVNPNPNYVTQYARALDGNIGLLAESNPAFLELRTGDILTVKRSKSVTFYRVIDISTYRATSPLSPVSGFINTETGEIFTSLQLGHIIYAGSPQRLVLQTCYDGANGRIFITALPIQNGYDLEAYK